MKIKRIDADAIERALYMIGDDNNIEYTMIKDWEEPNKPLEFTVSYHRGYQDIEDLSKTIKILQDAERIIKKLNKMELVIEKGEQEKYDKDELFKLTIKWFKKIN